MRLMTVAVLSTVALATLATVIPAAAQAPPRRNTTERITVIDQYGHRTTRITVRPRSFLDPGTATKPGWEHSTDYAYPPNTYSGEYFGGNQNFQHDWKASWSRMPFPTCFDAPGMCR
jgi:hypothetical protein